MVYDIVGLDPTFYEYCVGLNFMLYKGVGLNPTLVKPSRRDWKAKF